MRELYSSRPAVAQLAEAGLTEADFAGETEHTELFPENWEPFIYYTEIMTQWRCGPGGFYGLDYNIVYADLNRLGLGGAKRDDFMWAIRTIESTVLRLRGD